MSNNGENNVREEEPSTSPVAIETCKPNDGDSRLAKTENDQDSKTQTQQPMEKYETDPLDTTMSTTKQAIKRPSTAKSGSYLDTTESNQTLKYQQTLMDILRELVSTQKMQIQMQMQMQIQIVKLSMHMNARSLMGSEDVNAMEGNIWL